MRRREGEIRTPWAHQRPLKETSRIPVDPWSQDTRQLLLDLRPGFCTIMGWWVLFFLASLLRERAWWRSLSLQHPQRVGLFIHSNLNLFVLWSAFWEMEHWGRKKRYAAKCLKYNLIWAKCSPQDPKNETRGHLASNYTGRMTQIGRSSRLLESIQNQTFLLLWEMRKQSLWRWRGGEKAYI